MTGSRSSPASHVLRGYRYQLLQSLDAWMGLRPGEVLWLETEEDFSIVSDTKAIDTQVKSSSAAAGPRRISLQSEGVRSTLARFWARSNEGQDERSHVAFIAAQERGLSFPNDKSGIDYWTAAKRAGPDPKVRKIRDSTVTQRALNSQWTIGPTTFDS